MNEITGVLDAPMMGSLLNGARLLEVTERSPAQNAAGHAAVQQDSRPILVFDAGVLRIDNPFQLQCDSGERVSLPSIIGCHVSETYSTATDFFVVFEGRISLAVSLREEDFIGPEAASFHAASGQVVSIN